MSGTAGRMLFIERSAANSAMPINARIKWWEDSYTVSPYARPNARPTQRTAKAMSHAITHWVSAVVMEPACCPSRALRWRLPQHKGVEQHEYQKYDRGKRRKQGADAGYLTAKQQRQRGYNAFLCGKAGNQGGGHAPVRKAERCEQRCKMLPSAASRLLSGIDTTLKRASKVCRNQITIEAAKIMVNASG